MEMISLNLYLEGSEKYLVTDLESFYRALRKLLSRVECDEAVYSRFLENVRLGKLFMAKVRPAYPPPYDDGWMEYEQVYYEPVQKV